MGITNWRTGSRLRYANPNPTMLCLYTCTIESIPASAFSAWLQYALSWTIYVLCIMLTGILPEAYVLLYCWEVCWPGGIRNSGSACVSYDLINTYSIVTSGINHTCMALSLIQHVGYHMQCNGRFWGAQLALFTLHLICYSPIQVSIITTGLRIISYRNQVSDNTQYRSETEYRKQRLGHIALSPALTQLLLYRNTIYVPRRIHNSSTLISRLIHSWQPSSQRVCVRLGAD